MEFCEKLQQLRTKKGFTQEQLAERVCVSRVAVAKWESGRGYPNLDSLKMLAKVFDVSIDQLLSSEELIDMAQDQSKKHSKIVRSFIFGIADFMAGLLFFIPVFANRFEGKIKNVNLMNLCYTSLFVKNIFLIIIGLCTLFGAAELAFQNIQSKKKQKIELILSGMISSSGILFSALTNQPYCCVYLFILFIVKILSLQF